MNDIIWNSKGLDYLIWFAMAYTCWSKVWTDSCWPAFIHISAVNDDRCIWYYVEYFYRTQMFNGDRSKKELFTSQVASIKMVNGSQLENQQYFLREGLKVPKPCLMFPFFSGIKLCYLFIFVLIIRLCVLCFFVLHTSDKSKCSLF